MRKFVAGIYELVAISTENRNHNDMTLFSSSYINNRLFETSMAEIETLITSETNKIEITNAIYERLYER